MLSELGVATRVVTSDGLGQPWPEVGRLAARGEILGLLANPGVLTPTLLATVCAAACTFPGALLVPRTLEIEGRPGEVLHRFFARLGWPANGRALLEAAITEDYRWLDPLSYALNVFAPLVVAAELCHSGVRGAKGWNVGGIPGRVQLLGDAMVRPVDGVSGGRPHHGSPEAPAIVDASLSHFGQVPLTGRPSVARPAFFVRQARPRLSVVVIAHDMRRELPRTLASLHEGSQHDITREQYEVIVVDNGSADPLDEAEIHAACPRASYLVLRDPPPSPGRAINHAVAMAKGDVLAIMIDGACLVSPGILAGGLRAFRAFPRPVVASRYFFLGPGDQVETIWKGYDRDEEDRLLESIAWPADGYRLFEISSPLTFGGPVASWLSGWIETNCLFLARSVFYELLGCDERFDYPGGGFLSLDLLLGACSLPDTQPVQLLGEGVFHQVHGGITTNTTQADLDEQVRRYKEQYLALRGPLPTSLPRTFHFMGSLRTPAARRNMTG